jgi:hypothetical protein
MYTSLCHRRFWLNGALVLAAGLLLQVPAPADEKVKERDMYDIEAQKAAKDVKRIVFIGDTRPHGPRGNHEFVAGAVYLARTINARYPDAYAVVTTMQKFPKDLKHADTVIVLMNNADPAAENPAVKEAMDRGAGFMAIHYGVEVSKGPQGKSFLHWLGGYFEPYWSVNPWWTPKFEGFPKHEIAHGVKPFAINDEWYYHMRFVKGMKGVTPILSALPPLNTIQGGGEKSTSHGGNPDVYKEVSEGKKQVMAWAYERPDGGRGFGFTGLHKHANLADNNFRTVLLNAVAWVSKLPVPSGGVQSDPLSRDDLEKLIDDGKLAVKRRGI